MTSESFQRWRQAEHEAREAAFQLQAALRSPGRVPDRVFVEQRLRRAQADEALQEFIRACEQDLQPLRERLHWKLGVLL